MKSVNPAIVANTNRRLFDLQEKNFKQNNLKFFQELRSFVERYEITDRMGVSGNQTTA